MIRPKEQTEFYSTQRGMCINGRCEDIVENYLLPNYSGKIQLIFTSPPFPLNRAKKYGNLTGETYKKWLCDVINSMLALLTENGSLVIELGNAWNTKEPTFSTLPIETLLQIKNKCQLFLCEEFVYYNPARLPSPVQYVNIERSRVKDSFTHIWWLSRNVRPKANNRNVLKQYSIQMQKLLKSGTYNSGNRPSEHKISKTAFSINHGGSIPSNVLIASNTRSNDPYITECKKHGLRIHPARMPVEVPSFFINLLTDEADIVLDCFAGSNTTGYCAELHNRHWISIEAEREYYTGSYFRFSKFAKDTKA